MKVKPPAGWPINPGHPLSKCLCVSLLYNEGAGQYTRNYAPGIAGLNPFKFSSHAKFSSRGAYNLRAASPNHLNYIYAEVPLIARSISSFTFATNGNFTNGTDYSYLFIHRGGSNYGVGTNGGGTGRYITAMWNNANFNAAGALMPDGVDDTFICVAANGNGVVGRVNDTNWVQSYSLPATQNTNSYIVFGADTFQPQNRAITGTWDYSYIWFDRMLTDAEMQSVRRDPYQMFEEWQDDWVTVPSLPLLVNNRSLLLTGVG